MRELVIGGLRFAVDAPAGLEPVEDDATYASFLTPGSPADLEVAVSLTLDPAPDVAGLPVLFDTEETWAAFSGGDGVVLRLRTKGGPADYLWQAHMFPFAPLRGDLAPGGDRIRVYCGPLLIDRREDAVELRNPLHYPLDQLLLMFLLARRRGVIVHAAGLARAGRGVFLAGRSGAGKTTFMRLCAGREDLVGLSDDRVVVREIDGALSLFGTPWAGEGRVAANRRADLAAIAFLHQSERNHLRPIGAAAALQQLLATVSILWFDRPRMEAAMRFCERLVSSVPCYELHFRPEAGAVEMLDELMPRCSLSPLQ